MEYGRVKKKRRKTRRIVGRGTYDRINLYKNFKTEQKNTRKRETENLRVGNRYSSPANRLVGQTLEKM